jgi:pimeloyl-ACP methyl ester carboxylesterase
MSLSHRLLQMLRFLRITGYSMTVYPLVLALTREKFFNNPQVTAARERLKEMSAAPRPLPRPVLLLHGLLDLPARFDLLARQLEQCTSNAQGLVKNGKMSGTCPIDTLAQRLAQQYAGLGEIDVIAHSMGNLAVRQACFKHGLKVHRLFSLAGPHGGGRFTWPLRYWHPQIKDMAPGSKFLSSLNAAPSSQDFEIRSWHISGDSVVSRKSAHLVSDSSRELPLRLFIDSHVNIAQDCRVMAEVIDGLLSNE